MSFSKTLSKRFLIIPILLSSLLIENVEANVKVPSIFGSNMVLQRNQKNPVWGWAEAGEKVVVTIAGQSHSTTADANGNWQVILNPLSVGAPHQLIITGKNRITLKNVLVGEVWLCSGQSNMAMRVNSSDDADIERLTANYPKIRLITIPNVGIQEPQKDFVGEWSVCTPATAGNFSAVGYFFGRQLHQTIDVPIGLIDNSWGGSAAEAWVRRDLFKTDERYTPLLQKWEGIEKNMDENVKKFKAAVEEWEKNGKSGRRPRDPRGLLTGNSRPGNLYNGKLNPIIGYGIRGAIWYQGESNASRAYQYRHLFPLMIQNWRDVWKQGDFPFYWVQLADFYEESPEPVERNWAELREAQTMTMNKLHNTGEAVIIDIGEAHDIHPKNKQDVGKRLARLALKNEYGVNIASRSPILKSFTKKENKITVTFDHVGTGMDTFDVRTPIGFAIAGEDKKFVWASAKIVARNKIEVWSDSVKEPVSVRYGWAQNPVCNVQSKEGLPLTPFRTDEWPGVTVDAK